VVLFVEPNLDGWAMGGKHGSPDVLWFKKSHANPDVRVFEVKATQSDLLADLRVGKWEKYLPLCDRLIFAVSEEVDYEKHLRPHPVGIMVFNSKKGTWRSVRAAPKHKREPWNETLLRALLFGRMHENLRDSFGNHYLRIERERRILRSPDLWELSKSANARLKETARELDLKTTSSAAVRRSLRRP
jgi:hypothetical protein